MHRLLIFYEHTNIRYLYITSIRIHLYSNTNASASETGPRLFRVGITGRGSLFASVTTSHFRENTPFRRFSIQSNASITTEKPESTCFRLWRKPKPTEINRNRPEPYLLPLQFERQKLAECNNSSSWMFSTMMLALLSPSRREHMCEQIRI